MLNSVLYTQPLHGNIDFYACKEKRGPHHYLQLIFYSVTTKGTIILRGWGALIFNSPCS